MLKITKKKKKEKNIQEKKKLIKLLPRNLTPKIDKAELESAVLIKKKLEKAVTDLEMLEQCKMI